MAVREFDGSDDRIRHTIGSQSAMTFGTTAAIFKTDTVTGTHALLNFADSGGTFIASGLMIDGTKVGMFSGAFGTLDVSLSTGIWYLAVIRKATGTATPRISVYNFNSTTWTHGNATSSIGDWTAAGGSGLITNDVDGSFDFWDGRMAVRACWSNEVHWTADGSGDTAIEGAGLEDALSNWTAESPDALWPYNQDPLAAVDDTIGGADQSSVVGTTVVTGDDPPGFTFELGGGGVLVPRVIVVAG
jgi:hypothetical protein